MGVRESLLNTITSVADSDFVRIVTAAGASSKATVKNLFKGFESNLGAKSSLTTSDYIRVVGSDNEAYKQSVSSVKDAMGVTVLEENMGAALQSGADFNTLTLPADNRKIKIYHGQDVRSISNGPSGISSAWPFCLELLPLGTNATYTKQVLHVYGTVGMGQGNVYERAQTYSAGATVWSEWKQQPTRAEVDALNSKWVAGNVANVSIPNVSAGATVDVTINATKSGYAPIGLLGCAKGGAANGLLLLSQWYMDGNSLVMRFYNAHTSTITGCTVTVSVLYRAT